MLLPDVLCCSLQRESICPGMPCSHQPGVKLFSSMTLWCDCEGRIQASDTTLQDSSMTSTSNTGEGPVGRSGPWMTMESLMDFFLPPNTGKTYSLQPTSRAFLADYSRLHLGGQHIHQSASREGIHVLVRVASRSQLAESMQVHSHQGITGQNPNQILCKTTPKTLMIYDIVTLVHRISMI